MPSPTLPLDCTPTAISDCVRRSSCCGAPVYHPNSPNKRLSAALLLICSQCGGQADKFEVWTAQNQRIWPVPRGFHANGARKCNDLGRLWR